MVAGRTHATPTVPAAPPAPDRGGERRQAGTRRQRLRTRLARLDIRLSPYGLVAPFFVLFAVFGVFPLVYTIWVSLHHWNLLGGNEGFVGLANYGRLLGDGYFWNAVVNTFGIFVVATVPQLFMAFGLAALLNRFLRARTFFRMGVLVPNITSVAAVALIFAQLFGRDFGLVNYVLGLIGIDGIDWQANRLASWVAIATMVDWRWTGYMSLICLAGMQALPRSVYEAAEIDGASAWRQFWSITVPMMRPVIVFSVIIATIGGVQLFTEPLLFDTHPAYATGGAGREFQTLALYMYEHAFKHFDFGYAAAIAWVLFMLVMLVAGTNYLLSRRIRGTE